MLEVLRQDDDAYAYMNSDYGVGFIYFFTKPVRNNNNTNTKSVVII